MAKKEIVNERLANNMAYLDNQISKTYEQLQNKYSELMSKAEPFDKDGNVVTEMIPGQFTINCPEAEIDKLTLDAKDEINYICQCVDELEKIVNESPKDVQYTDEEIAKFLSKVADVNSKEMRLKRISMINNESFNHTEGRSVRTGANTDLPKRIVEYARNLIGTPYVWGGFDPNKHGGVDCSGLVVYCANQCGYTMKRETTSTLINMGTEVSRNELQVGDLIFPKSSHVGFYSGNGKFLHAPKPGDKVKEVDIYAFWRARRIFPGVGGTGSSSSSSSSSGDYYGPGESTELIERTPDPEVTKVIVPQGSANWTAMASYLGVSVNSLKKLNPGITTLYAGIALYIPTTSVTQARELAAKAKNSVASSSRMINDTYSLLSDNIMLTSVANSVSRASVSASTEVTEQTPFQKILNNEDYIKTYDLKEHNHKKARLEIRYDGKVRTIQTLIAPIAYNETYSNNINVEKTAGGWFVSRHGENLTQLNISGYLLDTKYAPEKHAFMDEFKKYMTDTRNSTTGEYENNAIIKVTMEGVEYQGHVTSVTFNKDASRPSLYTFNLAFTCLYYKNIRDVESAINSLTSSTTTGKTKSIYLGDEIASIMNNS